VVDPSGREQIPIGLVAHHVFCPRRAWLEAQGEQTDTRQVAIGVRAHQASDDPAVSRPDSLRAVDVRSDELGLVGRCDTVEVGAGGELTVVEHKATPVRRRAEVTPAMRVQVALQVIALREMGHVVVGGAVWFSSHGERVAVELTGDTLEAARTEVAATRSTVENIVAPAPLEDDPRCSRCSHIGVCLPDERALAPVARRIVVADPDAQVVHLATPGSRASTRRGRLVVEHLGESLASLPLERVQGVVVHGNVDLSAALTRELLWRGLTVVWCSSRGRVVGWAASGSSPNGSTRLVQSAQSAAGRLDLAREFVAAKIANQATFARRHGAPPPTVRAMRDLSRRAMTSRSTAELFGVEGDAAARYFAAWPGFVPEGLTDHGTMTWDRTRRPARDPLNAALNYAYAMTLADVVRAIVACGLDPHAGFLHSAGRNKPALALDLMEELRTPVAESVVLRAINNGELGSADFATVMGAVSLRERGRKALIEAYERRVQERFRHPVFGYETTWRRAMEVQARLVLGVLDGSQSRYIGLRIR